MPTIEEVPTVTNHQLKGFLCTDEFQTYWQSGFSYPANVTSCHLNHCNWRFKVTGSSTHRHSSRLDLKLNPVPVLSLVFFSQVIISCVYEFASVFEYCWHLLEVPLITVDNISTVMNSLLQTFILLSSGKWYLCIWNNFIKLTKLE